MKMYLNETLQDYLLQTFDHHVAQFTFSLYSSLMMEQFRMDGGSSLGMVITLVTVSFLEGSMASAFSLRISFVQTLLRPWAKKLFFSYRMNLGFTERLEWLLISAMTWRGSPVKCEGEESQAVITICGCMGSFWALNISQGDQLADSMLYQGNKRQVFSCIKE